MPDFNFFHIYSKNKLYTESEIYDIACKHKFSVTDCLKIDNEITVALDEEAEPIWQFEKIGKDCWDCKNFQLKYINY